jgi:hypothetical protein
MRDVVICAPLRTPVGRFGGALRSVPAQDLASLVIRAVLDRSGLPGAAIDDVVLGHCYPTAEAPAIGRVAALDAGLPVTVGGLQFDRRCGSGLQAVIQAALAVPPSARPVRGSSPRCSTRCTAAVPATAWRRCASAAARASPPSSSRADGQGAWPDRTVRTVRNPPIGEGVGAYLRSGLVSIPTSPTGALSPQRGVGALPRRVRRRECRGQGDRGGRAAAGA